MAKAKRSSKDREGFEEHLEALERIVEELDTGDLPLERALARYEEGVRRVHACSELLRKAEERVKILRRDLEGALREEPFEEEEE